MFSRRLSAILINLNGLNFFFFLFSLSLVSRVWSDIYEVNRWAIHRYEAYPYRYIGIIPLYSTSGLLFEWLFILVGAVLVHTERIRWGALLCCVGLLMSLSQTFQNQKILLLLISLGLLLGPPMNKLTEKSQNESVRFLKWQLYLVYAISAINKIFDQFGSGETLQLILQSIWNYQLPNHFMYVLVSWLIIVGELGMPLLLLHQPRLGISLVFILHIGFALAIRDVWPFSLAMLALSFLFLPGTVKDVNPPSNKHSRFLRPD